MNKRYCRIVFNRVRQAQVVVSELTLTHGSGKTRGPGRQSVAELRALALSVWLASGLVCLSLLPPVFASEIYVDKNAPKGQQPTLQRSDNGLPQIDIQTPNKHGVSRNSYTQFDVDKRGVVLNNSRKRSRTQLAGMMAANPWLAKGEAKVILNEINSRNPSQLKGYIEVAGKKADVIIANPAGITCAGCGFINSGKTVLAAAKARVDSGLVTGFDVDRGKVVIAGQGMDSRGQDYTALIARAVEVNAKVQANQMQVTTGRNRTDADGRIVSVQKDDPAGGPAFALDVAALGGMYANKITLVGSEHGVGVRNAGELGASGGTLRLSTAGKLTNSGTLSGRDGVELNSKEINNRGNVMSQGNMQLHHQGDFTNSGVVRSAGNLALDVDGKLHNTAHGQLIAGSDNQLSAGSIQGDSGSVFAAGIDSQGNATQAGSLTLTSRGTLASHGMHLSQGSVSITGDNLDLSGSHSQGNQVSLTARKQAVHTDNAAIHAKQLTVATPTGLSNRGGSLSADKLVLSTPDFIDNRQGKLVQRGQDALNITAKRIDNSQGTLVNQGALTLNAANIVNREGLMGSQRADATVNTTNFQGERGKLIAGNTLNVKAGTLNLDSATTQAHKINITADTFSHQRGKLLQTGSGTAHLKVHGTLNNSAGQITSLGGMELDRQRLINQNGIIGPRQDVQVNTKDSLDNSQQGTSQSTDGNVTVSTQGTVNNTTDKVRAQHQLSSQSVALINRRGALLAEDIALITGELNNLGGLVQSKRNIDLKTQGHRLINHKPSR